MIRLNRWNRVVDGAGPLQGAWRLTRDHELEYRREGPAQEVILSGPILRAEAAGLTFRVSERTVDEDVRDRTFTLRGRWQADPRNRLEFVVDRREGPAERLTLQGAWQLGPLHEILYRTGPRERLLRFQGGWEIGEGRRLAYVLDRSADSVFRFRGAFQSPSLLPKTGQIRYQLGAEVEGRRRRSGPAITLFGKWKLSRDFGLTFELDRRDGRTRGIDFGADYSLGNSGDVQVELKSRQGEPLGMELTLNRRLLRGQGEAFLRLRRSIEESAVEGGLRFRW